MPKEIERKWLFNGDLQQITGDIEEVSIKDYYFNPFTRIRQENDTYKLTIKGCGTFVRDEFEIPLSKEQINFDMLPVLTKTRYYVNYKNHTFEINVFENFNLILVELEYNDIFEEIELPEWVGKEVTQLINYYGYHLYEQIQ